MLLVIVAILSAPKMGFSQNAAANVQSCRAFVQEFYDWYWNEFADRADDPSFDMRRLHTYHEVVRLRPSVLSPRLIRLFKRDERLSLAAHGIANLDFDPFLNSQDPEGKYDVVRVTVNRGACRSERSQRDIVVEAERSASGWVFSNFYYSFFTEDRRKREAPDDNLVHILSLP